jgi:hypothetical protein
MSLKKRLDSTTSSPMRNPRKSEMQKICPQHLKIPLFTCLLHTVAIHASPNISDVVTRVRVHLKPGLESNFARLRLRLRSERLALQHGLTFGSVRLQLGLGLEHETWGPSVGFPINLVFTRRPMKKLIQLNNRKKYKP